MAEQWNQYTSVRLVLLCVLLAAVAAVVLVADAVEWSYGDGHVLENEEVARRSLYGGLGAYISYGSLAADRVVCPPMSGRSYYLPNCQSATGPVNPYQRGCPTATRCARDVS